MNKNTIIRFSALFTAIFIVVTFLFVFERKKNNDKEAQLNQIIAELEISKQESLDEFENLALEYENYHFKPGNDSLLLLIENEKLKVKQLLEELRTVKATNARRIRELRNELGSVRSVLQVYVNRVDSLNNVNKKLVRENKKVQQQYEEVVQTAKELEERASQLDKKITLAAILEASNIRLNTLNDKGRETKIRRRIAAFEICFYISKNQTTATGLKSAYLRISNPQGNVMKNNQSSVFAFEDKEIDYSCKKEIEYTGNNLSTCVYYNIADEELLAGMYKVDVFIDGNLIGSDSFYIK
jgi:chromosome segregation ATPase